MPCPLSTNSFIWELPCTLERRQWKITGLSSGLVSHCCFYYLEFRVLFHLDRLQPKVKGPSLPCYFTIADEEYKEIHAFPKGISAKVNMEFELNHWFNFPCQYLSYFLLIWYFWHFISKQMVKEIKIVFHRNFESLKSYEIIF